MPRQNFLSVDFFLTISEGDARQALLTIPDHVPKIKFLRENALIHSMRFLYEQEGKPVHHYMDVTILPLNDQYIRFSIHASYTNGQAFNSDPELSKALGHFEQVVHAAVNQDYNSLKPKTQSSRSKNYMVSTVLSMLGMVFLWKKFTQ